MRGATAVRLVGLPPDEISIHAPHAGRDLTCAILAMQNTHGFQSTRPMRGATPYHPVVLVGHHISIHAPHAGRDWLRSAPKTERSRFQSTRPMRGATRY